VTTSSKPHFVERFNRTFKNLLHKRVTNYTPKKRLTEKTTPLWSDFVKDVLDTYNNNMVHSATGMTPLNASRKANELDAKVSMELLAQRGRKYPTLNVGDKVRILKSKRKVTKETTNRKY